jgi:D-alanine--poly(phosphoribitol) ligase subunit 2
VSLADTTLAETALATLVDVAGFEEIREDLDLPLYDNHILDSLKTVELLVALSERLNLEISPADLERGQWATPRLFIADLERRLARAS